MRQAANRKAEAWSLQGWAIGASRKVSANIWLGRFRLAWDMTAPTMLRQISVLDQAIHTEQGPTIPQL